MPRGSIGSQVAGAPIELLFLGALSPSRLDFRRPFWMSGISEEVHRKFFHEFIRVGSTTLFARLVIFPQYSYNKFKTYFCLEGTYKCLRQTKKLEAVFTNMLKPVSRDALDQLMPLISPILPSTTVEEFSRRRKDIPGVGTTRRLLLLMISCGEYRTVKNWRMSTSTFASLPFWKSSSSASLQRCLGHGWWWLSAMANNYPPYQISFNFRSNSLVEMARVTSKRCRMHFRNPEGTVTQY